VSEAAVRSFIEDSDLIAEREFELVDAVGKTGALHVRIARPVAQADGSWTCGLHLAEVEDLVNELDGEDSMQALVHALYMAPGLIEQLRKQGFGVTFFGHEELLLPKFVLPGVGGG